MEHPHICIDDLSGQINVFGKGYKLVTFWKNLVYICIWQCIEFFKFFMCLKIRRLYFLQKIERSSIPDFLFHLASMAEANWWLSNLDCMWALQVALIPLLFVSLPTLSPNKWGHLSSGSLHIPPKICPSSCPLHRWCHATISFSDALFSCPQSFPASETFLMSQLFA